MKILILLTLLACLTGCYKSIKYPVLLKDGTVAHAEYVNFGFDVTASNLELTTPSGTDVRLEGYNSQSTISKQLIQALVAAAAKGTP